MDFSMGRWERRGLDFFHLSQYTRKFFIKLNETVDCVKRSVNADENQNPKAINPREYVAERVLDSVAAKNFFQSALSAAAYIGAR